MFTSFKISMSLEDYVKTMKEQGYDEETAKRIYATMKNGAIEHIMGLELAKSEEDAKKLVAEKISKEPIMTFLADKMIELSGKVEAYDNTVKELEKKLKEQEDPAGKDAQALQGITQRVEALEQAVKIDPSDFALTMLLAETLAGLGQVEKGEAALLEGLEYNASSPRAHFQAGLFYYRIGWGGKAIRLLERAQSLSPSPHLKKQIQELLARISYK